MLSPQDYRIARKWSVVGFCTGAIAGLVAITPAAGFIGAPFSVAVGFLAAVVSNLLTKLKVWIRVDDVADLFSCVTHAHLRLTYQRARRCGCRRLDLHGPVRRLARRVQRRLPHDSWCAVRSGSDLTVQAAGSTTTTSSSATSSRGYGPSPPRHLAADLAASASDGRSSSRTCCSSSST